MTDKITGLIGLMRKASAVEPGEDRSLQALQKGKARLLLLPEDAPEKVRLRAERYTEGRSTLVIEMPLENRGLAGAVGLGNCNMMAVTDLGFANALLKALELEYPGRYAEQAAELEKRFLKAKRRKTEKPGSRTGRNTAGED